MAVLPGDRESRWGDLEQLLAGLEWAGRAMPWLKAGEPVGPRSARLVVSLKSLEKTEASLSLLKAGSAWLARYRCWQREAARDREGWSPAEQLEFAGIPEERYADIRVCGCLIDGADDPDLPAWFLSFSSKAGGHARNRGVRTEDCADCVQSFFSARWVGSLVLTYEPRAGSLSSFLFHSFSKFHLEGWLRTQRVRVKREDLFADPPESADSAGSPEVALLIRAVFEHNLPVPGLKAEDKELLWQKYVLGKSWIEISAERGTPPNLQKRDAHRLTERARKALILIRGYLGGLGAGV